MTAGIRSLTLWALALGAGVAAGLTLPWETSLGLSGMALAGAVVLVVRTARRAAP